MSGYTDTILIDCNRTNSAEKHTGQLSTSQFTCKVSDGLQLNVGDIVSVHSGFISERGCGDGDVIEITGRDLEVDYEVEETELQLFQKYLTPFQNSGTDVPLPPEGTLPPYGAKSYRYIQKSIPKRLTDNKLSMSITYYKTNNGQGYAMLPRRYDLNKAVYDMDASGLAFNWGIHAFGTAPRSDNDGAYDSYLEGRPMFIDGEGNRILQSDVTYVKNGTIPPASGGRKVYAQSYNTNKLFKYRQDNSRFTIMVCEQNYVGLASQFGVIAGDIRYVSDQAQEDPETINNTGPSRDSYASNTAVRHYRDPCLQEWIIYKETKDIEIEQGFQSPDAIAKQMSDQLQSRGSLNTIFACVGGKHEPPTTPPQDNLLAQSPVSVYSDSECYKAFPSANAVEFSKDRWTSYWENKATANPPRTADELNVIQYVQQYSTIGVKRPELWIAGRELLKNASQINAGEYDLDPHGNPWVAVGDTEKIPGARSWRNWIPGQMLNSIAYNLKDSPYHDENKIVTSYEWTDANLNYFKELFRQQGRDESLFKTGNSAMANPLGDVLGLLGSDKARFIHMNTTEGAGNVYPYSQLGCDNYEQAPGVMTNQLWQSGDPKVANHLYPKNGNSIPVFITFEPERENIARGGMSKDTDMYYGFAVRETVTMTDPNPPHAPKQYHVISFNTSRVGGIQAEAWGKMGVDWTAPFPKTADYYLSGDVNGLDRLNGYTTPRKLGYDPHFNAFGTASMVLYSGLLDGPSDNRYYIDSDATGNHGTVTRPVVHKVKQRYVGANEPTINWDPDESKFQIQALHTPEYTGNEPNAGEDTGENSINADAGTPVWQINKHLLNRDFCPDMMPYQKDVAFTGSKAKVSPSNINIEPWEPFDALCGVFIESFNVNEDKWQDSLMGIMGFEYNQFNSTNTLNQRQRRLNDEITFTPQGSLTTNAVIKSSDLIQFTTNVFGAQMYEGSLPIIESDTDTAKARHGFYSVISDKQVSCSIEAQRLPRKMLTPYYIIRSDIIADAQYNSDGKALPIVYVVNKENGFGDFFFQNTTETNFTVTKARTITDITTSIHNPDMSIATTNEGSGIIYKIIKNNNADMNVAEEILNKNKKK